jgi:dipeptidyl aminopeptidase/acylaminoacyl peptidase
MKSPLATAALTAGALVAAGCGGGRLAVERHLVFVHLTQPTNATVWIADANGRRAHRLTRGYAVVVSPDGRTIAVGRSNGIHLVSSDGTRERRLTTANRWPEAWSADRKWIIATTDYSLAVVDADSGRSRVVARGAIYGFGFSPDGHYLIYARAPRKGGDDICSARPDLYVIGLADGARSRVTRDGRSAFPAWGRRRIAFMRLPRRQDIDDCFAPGIWTVRPDGSDARPVISRAPRMLSHAGYYGLQPVAWLQADVLLVGVRSEWGNQGATLDIATKRLRRLDPCAAQGAHHDCHVDYVDKASHDGRLAVGDGGNEKITISIIRVGDGRPIFTLRGDVCCPDWNR